MMSPRLYYETLDCSVYRKNFFRRDQGAFLEALKKDFATDRVLMTRAGRTGIMLSLRAFGLKRADEVLVPNYMSTCVLDSVNQVATPSLHLTDRTRAVLFYHHWGFSQNYTKAREVIEARKLRVIEDCAHGVWGRSQGHTLGDFGHTAIFSLSKIFPMTYAGALRVNDESLWPSIQQAMSSPISFKDRWESFQGERTYLKFYNAPLADRGRRDLQADLLKWYATLLTYPNLTTVRGELPRDHQELRGFFQKQNRYFLKLLKSARQTVFMRPDDDETQMAPLCFPVLSDDVEFLGRVDRWLKDRNVVTGIYHFDVNRSMFDPVYKKCVPIPLYASLADGLYDEFVRDFKGEF